MIDDANCHETIRRLRWVDVTVQCPFCESIHVIRHGHDNTEPEGKKYLCNGCLRYFDELSCTIFEGDHQPLRIWILCLYFMGLNLSNRQIAQELDLNEDDMQQMTEELRGGISVKKTDAKLEGEFESDEIYIVAGHKGNTETVREKGREGRSNRLKGLRGRGSLEKEKPPVLGLIQRGGDIALTMPENVKQETIAPVIQTTIVGNTLV